MRRLGWHCGLPCRLQDRGLIARSSHLVMLGTVEGSRSHVRETVPGVTYM